MPFVKISSEVNDTMKKYLTDIEGVSVSELTEGAIIYAMENLEAFEKFLGIVDLDEADETQLYDEKDEDEDETKKEGD